MIDIESERRARIRKIATAQRAVEKARAAYRAALSYRDEMFMEVHGKQAQGMLSYTDIAAALNGALDKGRIIQIVQNKREELGTSYPSSATDDDDDDG